MAQKNGDDGVATGSSNLDSTDLLILRQLGVDGQTSAKEMAEKLSITPPTVYSRLKNLFGNGILKIVGLVDIFKVGHYQAAIVAINVSDDSKLMQIMEALDEFEEVQWSVSVTGRYDIFVEVILDGTMEALFDFHSEKLSKLDGVANSESFVIMKSKNKWFSLP